MVIVLRATGSRSSPLFASAKGGGSGELASGHTIGFLFLGGNSGGREKARGGGIWKLEEHKEKVAVSSMVVQRLGPKKYI